MILTILLTALVLAAAFVTAVMLRAAATRWSLALRGEAVGVGAVANFLDTLGIGSFAPTMAWMKFRSMVPDRLIPSTMLSGYTLPTMAQSAIFLVLLGVKVEPWLLLGCVVTLTGGALVGAPLAARAPVRLVQGVVGFALLVAAVFYALTNLDLLPGGGTASALEGAAFYSVIAANFALGVLLNFGVGHYAPTLVILSLLGFDPRLAFPIMATAGSFAAGAAATKIVAIGEVDMRIVLGLTVGAIPAVLVAAFVVKELPMEALRWLVVVVVLYASAVLLRQASKSEPAHGQMEPIAEGLLD